MEDCVFCKIVRGEIPAYKIYEDDSYLVFLDAFPSVKGQSLVIPKKHVGGYLFDMDDFEYVELMKLSKRVALATDEALNPLRTGIVVEGMQVPHVHIRLYPMFERKPLTTGGKIEVSVEEMTEIAAKISEKLN